MPRIRFTVDCAALTHLMDFLRREGVIPAEEVAVHERTPIDRCADAYEVYLREGRALATATIINYDPFVRDFLRHCFGAKPVELSCLSASDVLRFVRHQAPRLHRSVSCRRGAVVTGSTPTSCTSGAASQALHPCRLPPFVPVALPAPDLRSAGGHPQGSPRAYRDSADAVGPLAVPNIVRKGR